MTKTLVLVVDDQPLIADTIALILNRTEDLMAVSCYSAADGMQMAAAVHPGLVLLDLHMPGVTGLEHAFTFRDALGCRVLLISGAVETAGLLERTGGSNAFAILPKPVHPDELITGVRTQVSPDPSALFGSASSELQRQLNAAERALIDASNMRPVA